MLTFGSRHRPLSPNAWFLGGLALYRQGNYAGAEDAFYGAVTLGPYRCWFFLGNCYYLSGEVESSLACFDRLFAITGRYPKALYNKGVSLADLGRYVEAADAYRACFDMSHGVAVVLTKPGVALANLGQPEEAIRSFNEALAIDPCDPLMWYNKGRHFQNLEGRRRPWTGFPVTGTLPATGSRATPASRHSAEPQVASHRMEYWFIPGQQSEFSLRG